MSNGAIQKMKVEHFLWTTMYFIPLHFSFGQEHKSVTCNTHIKSKISTECIHDLLNCFTTVKN